MKVGDIVLQDYHHPNKFINWCLSVQDYFDDGIYNHAMIYYGFEEGEHKVLESAFDGVKIRAIDINDPSYVVLSPKKPFKKYIGQVMEEAYMEANKKYDYKGLIRAAFSTVLWKLGFNKIKLLKDNDQYFCSELVATIYEKAGNPLKIPTSLITPNDLYRSAKFKEQKIRR